MCACSGREGGQIRSESSKCVFVTKIIHVRAPMHLYHVRVCILGAAETRATLEAEVLATDACDVVASRHSHHHYLTGNVRTKLIGVWGRCWHARNQAGAKGSLCFSTRSHLLSKGLQLCGSHVPLCL